MLNIVYQLPTLISQWDFVDSVDLQIRSEVPQVEADVILKLHGKITLLILEVDPTVLQARIRFNSKVFVSEWADGADALAIILDLVRKALLGYLKAPISITDRPMDVASPATPRQTMGPEVAEAIILIVQHPGLYTTFKSKLQKANRAKAKLAPWFKHLKQYDWVGGTPVPLSAKRALPLLLSRMSSKSALQLKELVDGVTQSGQISPQQP